MKILGIETSCDETAAAVVEDGERILSNVVVSQIDIFAEYGGVIPEVAARSHLEVMMPVVDKALADASVSWDEIDAIAVTHAPGLLGSLLIGTLTARTLAILHDKPLYAVHHLKSHVYANWLITDNQNSVSSTRSSRPVVTGGTSLSRSSLVANGLGNTIPDCPSFPILALVVSGGHTQILYMPAHNQFEIIGTTRDDAVGECFDKVAKILGLPYPGGPSIAKAAEGQFELCSGPRRSRPSPRGERANSRAAALRNAPSQSLNCLPGDPNRYRLPHPKIDGLDFSFSGLKTAVLRAVQKEVGVPISYPSHKLKELLSPEQVRDFAASFQKTAVEILLEKMQLALQQYPETQSVVVAGGVSANSLLRGEAEKLFCRERSGALAQVLLPPENFSVSSVYFPEPKLSGDNGAMVAAAAYYEIQAGVEPTDPYSLNIYPRISIEN
ncbi:tRNA (adenosine(37)-N6)-threonylcarbamoyltransferase complex transferase subunit TsaD [Candidatus Saccharibacteria bacterium]|nr:tRNA (adenosine(37)-N6)-threonylcarbamoyltransferase complex transferase subunit TsaD [Candidatus Saccharibacteria bacterium]